ncbi:MAG: PCMD domain-containing protein [Prevotellaceae bacterium]|nr:PCMD domain-containing protein [Prevotellaceae bacterium]
MIQGSKYIALLFFAIALSGCADIDGMSDEASITSFHVMSCRPEGIRAESPVITGRTITIPYKNNAPSCPGIITVEASYATAGNVVDVLIDAGDDPSALVFEVNSAFREISLITKSGVPVTYTVKLEERQSELSIFHFEVQDFAPAHAGVPPVGVLNFCDKTITLLLARDAFPLTVTPAITLFEGASFKDYAPGAGLEFQTAGDVHTLTVMYDGEELDWTVRLDVAPQLPNSGFDDWFHAWSSPNETKEQIGRGAAELFWCTTNDPLAGFETTKVAGERGGAGDYAAQLHTNIKDVVGIRKLGAAGLFTGFFKLNLAYLDDPVRMTKMGRPFLLRPVKAVFSGKYTAGRPYYMQDPETKMPVETSGNDQGSCRVRLEHWTNSAGKVLYNYTPVTQEEYEAITREVVGEGERLISPVSNWTRMEVPVTYHHSTLQVTHIIVDFASSKDGASFRGADGSVLTVDNFELLYD